MQINYSTQRDHRQLVGFRPRRWPARSMRVARIQARPLLTAWRASSRCAGNPLGWLYHEELGDR
jgi:hypothetical protein